MDNKIKEHFKNHNKSEVFQTSDGFLFHKDFDAKANAATLKDKTVVRHERGKVSEESGGEPKGESKTAVGDNGEKAKEPKVTKAPKAPAADKKTEGKATGKNAKAAKADLAKKETPATGDNTAETK